MEGSPLSAARGAGILRGSEPRRTRPIDAKQFALDLADLLDENYAEDLRILDVSGPLAIADYFVIGTAKNARHAQALARVLMPCAKSSGAAFRRQAGLQQKGSGAGDSGWALLDFDLVVVHLFDEERRAFYALEDLYADVPEVEFTPRERPDGIPADAIPGLTEGAAPGSAGNFEDAFDDLAAYDDAMDDGAPVLEPRRNFPDSAWPESVDEI